ncbi:MAG: hypothetical protein WD824_10895 [Cyclobacteriaceae bacterium]
MRINSIISLVPGILVMAILGCGTEEMPTAQRMTTPASPDELNLSERIGSADADLGDAPRYSDWSEPVNLGPDVNSSSEDFNPAISRDGLSLYLGSPRPAVGMVGPDLWVSRRTSVEMPWGPAQNLGSTVNMAAVADNGAALSIDGHRLFFHSNRLLGFGGNDLYVSRRRDHRDDFGWEAPVNLGSAINSTANDVGPAYFEDQDGTVSLYFTSNRLGGPGATDVYASTLGLDGSFGPPVLVAELSSNSDEQRPAIRRDGLEIFLASNRPGTLGEMDIWVATRATTSDRWSTPQNLGSPVNTIHVDTQPSLSFDGTTLYFTSANREGNIGGPRFDIWSTTRERLTGPEPD